MPDENGQGPPVDKGKDGKTGEDKTPNGQVDADKSKGGTNDAKTFSEEYVKTLRDEAAGHRTKLREVEAERDKLKTASLSEEERKQAELDGAKAKLQEAEGREMIYKVQLAAAKNGALDPEVVGRMVDPKTENAEKAVLELKAKYPSLFRNSGGSNGSADGGKDGKSGSTFNMNEHIRKAAGRG